MFLVSVGGLEVAGFRHLWSFFRLAHAVRKEAMNAEGNISVDLFRQGRIFVVVSVFFVVFFLEVPAAKETKCDPWTGRRIDFFSLHGVKQAGAVVFICPDSHVA